MWASQSVHSGCALKSAIRLAFGGSRLPRTFHRKCSIVQLLANNSQSKLSKVATLSNLSAGGIQREALLLTQVLKRHGVYGSHLFFERPNKISEDHLEEISIQLMGAVSSQNVSRLALLGRKIPSDDNQLIFLRDTIKKSVGEILFNIKLDEHVTAAIDSLREEFNQNVLVTLVKTLYYNSWLMGNDGDFASVLDQLVLSHRKKMDVPHWCSYMNWRVTITSKNLSSLHEIGNYFIVAVAPKCVSLNDVLATGMLLKPVAVTCLSSHTCDYSRILRLCSEIALKHSKIMFDDIDTLACVCRYLQTLAEHDGYYRAQNADFSSLLWKAIAHHMKHYQEQEMSTGLGICIKGASLSMNKDQLMSSPQLFSQTFDNMRAITPKLCRLSPIMGVKLFYGMVRSRHVDVAAAELFIQYFQTVNWEDYRVKEAAWAVRAMGEYGCTDTSLYEPLVRRISSPASRTEFDRHPQALLAALTGLSYVQILPPELYDVLFKALNATAKLYPVHMMQLVYLDDVLSDLFPSYKGERLNPVLKERGLEIVAKLRFRYDKLDRQMRTSILDTINSVAELTDQYIAELKPELLLEGRPVTNVVLTSRNKSIKDVSIIVLHKISFMRLYRKTDVTLQPLGLQKIQIVRLQKRGHVVVVMNFDEYRKAKNKSQLIIAKLKAAKVIR